MQRIKQIASIVALALAGYAALELGMTAHALRQVFASNDVVGIVANLTVLTRHADRSLGLADEASKAAKAAADKTVNTQQAFIDFIGDARTGLTGANGTLPRLNQSIASLNDLVVRTNYNLNQDPNAVLPNLARAVDRAGGASVQAMQAITARASNPQIDAGVNSLAAASANLNAASAGLLPIEKNSADATAELAGMLHDLREPQHPGKFVRAVGLALTILRAGGQTAPLFK